MARTLPYTYGQHRKYTTRTCTGSVQIMYGYRNWRFFDLFSIKTHFNFKLSFLHTLRS